MKTKLGALLAVAAFLCLPAAAQTVDEVIAKHMTARGGLEKVKALQSLRMTGRLEFGPGVEAPIIIEVKRPNRMRMEFTVQGMTGSQAYDGKTGWQVMPFNGKKDAEPMSPEDLKDAQQEADMDGPLVDYKVKGNQVELIGKEDVEGAQCYKLKVTLKSGDIQYQYIDTDSNLEIKEESKRMVQGTEREVETTLGDYKEVQGLFFPFAIDSGVKGSPQRQKVIIDKIELNASIDDSRFAMPAPPPTGTKPADSKPPQSPAR
jgi:outer membrane lipoprotein-sorting protein